MKNKIVLLAASISIHEVCATDPNPTKDLLGRTNTFAVHVTNPMGAKSNQALQASLSTQPSSAQWGLTAAERVAQQNAISRSAFYSSIYSENKTKILNITQILSSADYRKYTNEGSSEDEKNAAKKQIIHTIDKQAMIYWQFLESIENSDKAYVRSWKPHIEENKDTICLILRNIDLLENYEQQEQTVIVGSPIESRQLTMLVRINNS